MKHLHTTIKALALVVAGFLLSNAANAQASDPDTLCKGTTTKTYSVTGTTGSTYAWLVTGGTFSPTSPTGTSANVNWAGVAPGTYTVKVTETTAKGCMGDQLTLNVVILPQDTLTLTQSSSEMCYNDVANYTLTVTRKGNGTGAWSFIHAIDGVSQASITVSSGNTYTFNPNDPTVPTPNNSGTTASTTYSIVSGQSYQGQNGAYDCTTIVGSPSTQTVIVNPKPATTGIFHN